MANDTKKPEVAAAAAEKSQADQMREAIAEGIAMGIAVASKSQPARTGKKQRVGCQICLQDSQACKGEHREIVVLPKNRKFARAFQGLRINGVTYLSNNYRHKIPVPAGLNVEYQIAKWEEDQEEMNNSRSINHNSGTMSGTGNHSINPAGNDGSSFR